MLLVHKPDAAVQPRCPRAQRDELIREHVGLARRISIGMIRGRHRVCRDDAVAAALLGLTEAADRYDASRGEPFAVFAKKRIRGAVLDELRRGDFLPRRVRRMARRAARARAELEMLGVTVTDASMASALGVTVDEYRDEIAPLAETFVHSIDGPIEMVELVGGSASPAVEAERRQAMRQVGAAVERMPPREAKVLLLRYGDDLPYRVIAEELGLTTARVCQIHGRAVARIRAAANPGGEGATSVDAPEP